jgi:putative DNA primase/helicase
MMNFAGVPGSGKSLIAGDIAARLSSGKNWFDCLNTFKPCETLFLAGEDDHNDTVVPRLQAAEADRGKIYLLKSVSVGRTSPEEREFQFDQDLKQIDEFLAQSPDVRLIIVDPVSNYLGNAKMNVEQEVRSVLIPLKKLAEKMNVAVIGIMHLNKKSDAAAINRIGGAMAFAGVARAVYLFQAVDDEGVGTHAMVPLKMNVAKKVGGLLYEITARPVMVGDSEEFMPFVTYTGTTTKDAESVLQPGADRHPGRPPLQLLLAKNWLEHFLAEGPNLQLKSLERVWN